MHMSCPPRISALRRAFKKNSHGRSTCCLGPRSYLATKACQNMVQELKEDGSKGPIFFSAVDNQSDIID